MAKEKCVYQKIRDAFEMNNREKVDRIMHQRANHYVKTQSPFSKKYSMLNLLKGKKLS